MYETVNIQDENKKMVFQELFEKAETFKINLYLINGYVIKLVVYELNLTILTKFEK